MKLIVFSDLHFHPWKHFAHINEFGVNSRLQDTINVIKELANYAIQNNIKTILFPGDFFHIRKSVYTQTYNLAFKLLKELRDLGLELILIPGNHDQADREGDFHSLYGFSTIATVLNSSQFHKYKDFNLFTLPYMEDVNKIRDLVKQDPPKNTKRNIFLGHLSINGAKLSTDFIHTTDLNPTIQDLNPEKFDVGFLGHYHLHQGLGNNFYYVGSPLQHNWSDKNINKSFLVYDTEDNSVQAIPLSAPKFVELEQTDFDSILSNKHNFIKYKYPESLDISLVQEFCKDNNITNIIFDPIKEEVSTISVPQVTSLDLDNAVLDYIKSNTQGLDTSKLELIYEEVKNWNS